MNIKLFEEYNDDFYYTKIGDNEFDNFLRNQKIVVINIKEVDKIKESIDSRGIFIDYTLRIEGKRIEIDIKKGAIDIYKDSDEWYYVASYYYDRYGGNTFYRCDQFDGLLKCLEDII